MSRLGRDYLKVGQVIEILRQKGIRLIAINDGIDSDKILYQRYKPQNWVCFQVKWDICKAMILFGKGKHQFPVIDNRFKQNFIFYGSPEAKELERKLSVQFFETFGHTHCSISLLYNNALFCGDAAMKGFPSVKRITIWIENCNDFYNSWEKIIFLKPKMITACPYFSLPAP